MDSDAWNLQHNKDVQILELVNKKIALINKWTIILTSMVEGLVRRCQFEPMDLKTSQLLSKIMNLYWKGLKKFQFMELDKKFRTKSKPKPNLFVIHVESVTQASVEGKSVAITMDNQGTWQEDVQICPSSRQLHQQI